MNDIFPLGFPPATILYLILYVATLVIHVVFMNYVLAGSGYLAARALFARPEDRIARMVKDWLPYALSIAITAGVAPLLFVQILYKNAFYTSNLLLFHRWMSILPVLIVGFYLLYLLRSDRLSRAHAILRRGLGVSAFCCFLFTGYSWTENHLLGLQGQEFWSRFYETESTVYFAPTLLARLSVWFFGSFPTLAMILGWQLLAEQRRNSDAAEPKAEARILAAIAILGLLTAVLAAFWYQSLLPEGVLEAITGPAGKVYLAAAMVGLIVQLPLWSWQWKRGAFKTGVLLLATVGVLVTVLGITVVREVIRLATLDAEALTPLHERAFKVGGFGVFIFFAIFNAAVLVGCILIVKRDIQKPA